MERVDYFRISFFKYRKTNFIHSITERYFFTFFLTSVDKKKVSYPAEHKAILYGIKQNSFKRYRNQRICENERIEQEIVLNKNVSNGFYFKFIHNLIVKLF